MKLSLKNHKSKRFTTKIDKRKSLLVTKKIHQKGKKKSNKEKVKTQQ